MLRTQSVLCLRLKPLAGPLPAPTVRGVDAAFTSKNRATPCWRDPVRYLSARFFCLYLCLSVERSSTSTWKVLKLLSLSLSGIAARSFWGGPPLQLRSLSLPEGGYIRPTPISGGSHRIRWLRLTDYGIICPMRECEHCWETKEPCDFERNARLCRECEVEERKARFSVLVESRYDADSARASWLRVRYRIDENEYNQLSAAQGGVCAICGNPSNARRLAVDHDGACCPSDQKGRTCGDCIRGLLCTGCNRVGLGWLERVGVEAVLDYLENGRERTAAILGPERTYAKGPGRGNPGQPRKPYKRRATPAVASAVEGEEAYLGGTTGS